MSTEHAPEQPEKGSEEATPLPMADRPASSAPGHWILARVGKRVLRPGGLELSLGMLRGVRVENADVVEFAPGLGRTATEILALNPASYTGVERDPDAARRVTQVIGDAGRCVNGDASATGLESACADVVVGEAMLTMQSERGKSAIVAEAARLLRPGGRYGIHELAVRPDDIDEETHTEIRQALARAIHVNARPLTVAQWRELLESHGLVVESAQTAPMALLNFSRNIRDEGVLGTLRIIRNVLKDREIRARVFQMRRTFSTYRDSMFGVAIVAHKPADSEQ